MYHNKKKMEKKFKKIVRKQFSVKKRWMRKQTVLIQTGNVLGSYTVYLSESTSSLFSDISPHSAVQTGFL